MIKYKILYFLLLLSVALPLNLTNQASSANIIANIPGNVVLDDEASTFTETQTLPSVIVTDISSTTASALTINALAGQKVLVESVGIDGGAITGVQNIAIDNIYLNGNDMSAGAGDLTFTPDQSTTSLTLSRTGQAAAFAGAVTGITTLGLGGDVLNSVSDAVNLDSTLQNTHVSGASRYILQTNSGATNSIWRLNGTTATISHSGGNLVFSANDAVTAHLTLDAATGSATLTGALKLTPTNTTPNATEGALWSADTANKLRYYDGSTWNDLF